MAGPGSASASSSHGPIDLPRTIRPREASDATSQSEIAAIRRVPAAAASSIVRRASVDRSALPATSQSHTWVSSKRRFGSEVLGITGPPRVLDRVDDVATYLDASGHATEEIDCLRFYRHQLGHRLASLCNDDRPALLRYLVHQAQTIGFEVRRGNIPVVGHYLMSMGNLYRAIPGRQ